MSSLVLWRSPFQTLLYFSLECVYWFTQYYKDIFKTVISAAAVTFAIIHFTAAERQLYLCVKWIILGILSSIGLGTGMHTFVLYLGPHIAAVTLAAYGCNSLNFPEPPYPDDIICPTDGSVETISILSILNKVKFECFMWGAGTAIGELPPYFLAKFRQSSKHSGSQLNSSNATETVQNINVVDGDSGVSNRNTSSDENSSNDSWETYLADLIQKVGFFGILLCASIPNPLFDLAGISCGTAQVPFLTFFGATLIGKAVNKMLVQTLFVIFVFSGETVENVIKSSSRIPKIGQYIHEPLREFFIKQKANLHRGAQTIPKEASWLGWAFEKFVMGIVIVFVISLINSMAQNYSARKIAKEKRLKSQ